MNRRLLIAEGSILLVAALVLWFVISPPLGGGDDDEGGGNGPVVIDRSDDDADGDDDEGGDDQPGDEGAGPEGDGCAPPVTSDFMRGNMLLTFYGSPDAETLGILGQHEPDDLVGLLNEQAQKYDDLNSFRGVQTGVHMVYATAQEFEGEDGLYIRRVDDETLEEYIDFACENKLLIFLDLQLGRADMETEIEKLLPYLEQTHVHLALDPEFAMGPGEVPGEQIGHLDATQINRAQEILQDFVEERDIPDKILIVHQFQDDMITNRNDIGDFQRVRLVIDMDGFGDPETKLAKYQTFSATAEYGGMKVFFQLDTPLMGESEILKARPDLVIYQ